jgi:hypothetical protein
MRRLQMRRLNDRRFGLSYRYTLGVGTSWLDDVLVGVGTNIVCRVWGIRWGVGFLDFRFLRA